MTFREKWLAAVDRKNSTICAGLDPADFEMGRGDEGLPEGANKLNWAFNYIEAVAPFVAAIKPNIQYWQDEQDMNSLYLIGRFARDRGLVVIEDKKLADIGATNDAGVYYAARKLVEPALPRADAVTFSPFAGNLEEAVTQAHDRNIGLISMVLMSNPGFEKIKNKLDEVNSNDYHQEDIIMADLTRRGITREDVPYVRYFVTLARDAQAYGVDMVVIGAPSQKNHLSDEEIETASRYVDDNMLVLMPGVGAQGGEAEAIYNHFSPDNVMVNVGRAMMFPNGSNSGKEEWAAVAKHYRDMVNRMRDRAV